MGGTLVRTLYKAHMLGARGENRKVDQLANVGREYPMRRSN